MTPSIRTIARLAGTSVSSVSRVINNSGYASPELRERVEAAIRSLHYTPSQGARMMRGAPSRMIGLILPSIDVPFFGILAHSIEQELFECGFQTMICSTAENAEHEARYIAMLLSQRIDGVIVASAFSDARHFRPLAEAGIPIIAIDRDLPGIADASVMADHEEGGRLMVRHLLAHGHRRIAIVGAPEHSQPVQLRLAGIRTELAKAGLEPQAVALSGEHSFTETYRLAQGVLETAPQVTALIGITDIAAIACIHAVHDLGFSVPGDYSVIGFDDLPEAMFVLPRLTTVAQPIRGLGIEATRRLADMIRMREAGEENNVTESLRMPVRLIERQSVAAAR